MEFWEGPHEQLTDYHYCMDHYCTDTCAEGLNQAMPESYHHTNPLSDQYHRFGISWNLNEKVIAYSVDGELLRLIDHLCYNSLGQTVPCNSWGVISTIYPNKKMNIIVNLAVLKPKIPPPAENIVGVMDIDYIKVLYPIDCDENKTVCCYCSDDNYDICPTTITGREVTLGGCSQGNFIIDGTDIKGDRNYLEVYATEKIIIKKGFIARKGCSFRSSIIDCPHNEEDFLITAPQVNLKKDMVRDTGRFDCLLYPNPVNLGDKVFINLSTPYSVEVIDSQSRIISNGDDLKWLETNWLKRGFYLVKIKAKDAVRVEKLIIR